MIAGEAALLDVRGVSVSARGRAIVDGVSFQVSAGEIVGVIGPNGAGKTTLLEAIVGLRRRQVGTIASRGSSLTRFADHARTFAFMPDKSVLPPELDTRAVTSGLSRARSEPLVSDLAERLHIASLHDKPIGILSRGERKRVALFVALALERPVVVLDEPFSAFDPLQMQDAARAVQLLASCGAAILTSVHQLSDAERLCDRLLLLARGRAIAFGTLDELRGRTGEATLENIFVRLLEEKALASA